MCIVGRVVLHRSHCSSAHIALTTWLLFFFFKTKRAFYFSVDFSSPFKFQSPAKYLLPLPRHITFLYPAPPGDAVFLSNDTERRSSVCPALPLPEIKSLNGANHI
ncbi:hypothetical protein I3843_04G070000 [Carya illinoinensis]|nr:hypothetical protein I3843_04G070000 [Carya illinoinensis]